jgi:tellurite resistance protein TerC
MADAASPAVPPPGSTVDAHLWHWVAVTAFVAVVLAVDLLVFHRHSRETTIREAGIATVFWCLLALCFNGVVWAAWGNEPALGFLTGYLVEWSLSMDNVFVFAVIFSYFQVPKKYQYRVLFWGILGAVVMRLTFVLAGAQLIERFAFVTAFFGIFLIYTAFKLMKGHDADVDPSQNLLYRAARRVFPVAKGDHGDQFFAREEGKLCVTPLFLVLVVVESTDVVFAVDSVPAIFGITKEPFIVFTSNLFAILGLRALYFLLAGVMGMFRYLNHGLSAIMAFVGVKMLLEYATHFEQVIERLPLGLQERLLAHKPLIPPLASLGVILSLLGIAIVASILANRRDARLAAAAPDAPAESTGKPAAEEIPANEP